MSCNQNTSLIIGAIFLAPNVSGIEGFPILPLLVLKVGKGLGMMLLQPAAQLCQL